jgi:hypothetical protein
MKKKGYTGYMKNATRIIYILFGQIRSYIVREIPKVFL